MSEKTVKFDNIRINKKEFNKFKQPINLDLVNVNQIVISDKFKDDDGFKYFTGYKEDEIVKPLCIILPQMSGYRKYFENGGKNMMCWINTMKFGTRLKTLNIKLHSIPVYDEKYMKAKVREFNSVIKTNFLGDEILKENVHCTCIACITIDSVVRMEKKNYPQVYLEECKYKMKKTKMSKFIDTELESESEPDTELESKSELESDTE